MVSTWNRWMTWGMKKWETQVGIMNVWKKPASSWEKCQWLWDACGSGPVDKQSEDELLRADVHKLYPDLEKVRHRHIPQTHSCNTGRKKQRRAMRQLFSALDWREDKCWRIRPENANKINKQPANNVVIPAEAAGEGGSVVIVLKLTLVGVRTYISLSLSLQ